MKFKGKVGFWWYLIIIGITGYAIYMIIDFSFDIAYIFALIMLLLTELLFVPIAVRNYVIIYDNVIKIAFGFMNLEINIDDLQEVSFSHNPISSMSASLDRIRLESKKDIVYISVRDKENFVNELCKKNYNIKMKIWTV